MSNILLRHPIVQKRIYYYSEVGGIKAILKWKTQERVYHQFALPEHVNTFFSSAGGYPRKKFQFFFQKSKVNI